MVKISDSTNKVAPSKVQRVVMYLIDDVKVRTYLITYLLVVVILATLYYCLTPYSNGLLSNGDDSVANVTYGESLYFSVVTVSSLGYGDFRPVGISRILAGLEVLFGLAVMGIMIAKITYSRLSHHVNRLYISEVKKQLGNFLLEFSECEDRFNRLKTDFGQELEKVPPRQPVLGKRNATSSVQSTGVYPVLHDFQLKIQSFKNYIEDENKAGGFFQTVPIEPLSNTSKALEGGLFGLGQLIISLPPEKIRPIFDHEDRKCIDSIMAIMGSLGDFVSNSCRNEEIQGLFRRLVEASVSIQQAFYEVPDKAGIMPPPDQTLISRDDPG